MKLYLFFLSLLFFSLDVFAGQTQLAAESAVKELTGVMGVLSDTIKVGGAGITISIIPYAFSKLKSML